MKLVPVLFVGFLVTDVDHRPYRAGGRVIDLLGLLLSTWLVSPIFDC